MNHRFDLSYITNLVENTPEGTILKFEGGLDMVEDLDKVSLYSNTLKHTSILHFLSLKSFVRRIFTNQNKG